MNRLFVFENNGDAATATLYARSMDTGVWSLLRTGLPVTAPRTGVNGTAACCWDGAYLYQWNFSDRKLYQFSSSDWSYVTCAGGQTVGDTNESLRMVSDGRYVYILSQTTWERYSPSADTIETLTKPSGLNAVGGLTWDFADNLYVASQGRYCYRYSLIDGEWHTETAPSGTTGNDEAWFSAGKLYLCSAGPALQYLEVPGGDEWTVISGAAFSPGGGTYMGSQTQHSTLHACRHDNPSLMQINFTAGGYTANLNCPVAPGLIAYEIPIDPDATFYASDGETELTQPETLENGAVYRQGETAGPLLYYLGMSQPRTGVRLAVVQNAAVDLSQAAQLSLSADGPWSSDIAVGSFALPTYRAAFYLRVPVAAGSAPGRRQFNLRVYVES